MIYVYMILPVPAAFFGLAYLANEVYGLYNDRSPVSHVSHLSGAAYGALYFILRRGL